MTPSADLMNKMFKTHSFIVGQAFISQRDFLVVDESRHVTLQLSPSLSLALRIPNGWS